MKKLLFATLTALFMVGTTSEACGGMWAQIRNLLALQEAIATIRDTVADPTPTDPTPDTTETPEEEPPPPPPPVFVQAAPDSLELWDAREAVAIPEEATPIQLEEQVIIS